MAHAYFGATDDGVYTPMAVGSVDSGLGADLDDGQPQQARSSSEEKDSLTPAQSRRKAQNRAAYVSRPRPSSSAPVLMPLQPARLPRA